MTYARTTISIPEELLYEIKKRALVQRKTITEVISEGLYSFLGYAGKLPKKRLPLTSLFGAWEKGESGVSYLKRVRYGKANYQRETYLKNAWRK